MAGSTKDHVVYEGTKDQTFVIVDGIEFRSGVPTEVPDAELRKELTTNSSDRLKGLKFSLSDTAAE